MSLTHPEPSGSEAAETVLGRLETMRDELDRSIALLSAEHVEDDSADAATLLSEWDGTQATLESLRRQRTSVEAAITRVKAGTYGVCASCRKPIPGPRLEARPDAARCLPCQARHDRRRR